MPAGFAVLTVMTASNATIQLGVAPEYRGRVMAIYLTIFLGGTPIGAPLIGWMSEVYGPRSALVLGGLSSLAVGVVALLLLRRVARQRSAPAAREDASDVVTEALAESVSLEEAGAYPGAAPVAQRQRQSP